MSDSHLFLCGENVFDFGVGQGCFMLLQSVLRHGLKWFRLRASAVVCVCIATTFSLTFDFLFYSAAASSKQQQRNFCWRKTMKRKSSRNDAGWQIQANAKSSTHRSSSNSKRRVEEKHGSINGRSWSTKSTWHHRNERREEGNTKR